MKILLTIISKQRDNSNTSLLTAVWADTYKCTVDQLWEGALTGFMLFCCLLVSSQMTGYVQKESKANLPQISELFQWGGQNSDKTMS